MSKTEASYIIRRRDIEYGATIKFKDAEGHVRSATSANFNGSPSAPARITIGSRKEWQWLHVSNVLEIEMFPAYTGRATAVFFNASWDDGADSFLLYEQNKEAIVDPKPFILKQRERYSGPLVELAPNYRVRIKDTLGGITDCTLSSVPAKDPRPSDEYFAVCPLSGPAVGVIAWVSAHWVIAIGKRDEDGALDFVPVEHKPGSLWDEFYEVVCDTYISEARIGNATIRTDHKDATVTDYKGHKNLAEMVKGHLSPLAKGLRTLQEHAVLNGDGDDASYWDHELNALLDIEKAIRADLNVEPWAESDVAAEMPKLCGFPGCIKPNCNGVEHGFGTEEERNRHFHPNSIAYKHIDECKPYVPYKPNVEQADDRLPPQPSKDDVIATLTRQLDAAVAELNARPVTQEAREQAWGGTITPDPVAGLHTQRTALEFDTHITLSLHTLRGILTDAVNVYERGAYDSVEDLVSARMYVVALTHKIE